MISSGRPQEAEAVHLPPPLLVKWFGNGPASIGLRGISLSQDKLCILAVAVSQMIRPLLTLHLREGSGSSIVDAAQAIVNDTPSLHTLGLHGVTATEHVCGALEILANCLPPTLSSLCLSKRMCSLRE